MRKGIGQGGQGVGVGINPASQWRHVSNGAEVVRRRGEYRGVSSRPEQSVSGALGGPAESDLQVILARTTPINA